VRGTYKPTTPKDAKSLEPMYAENTKYIFGHVSGLAEKGIDAVIANFLK